MNEPHKATSKENTVIKTMKKSKVEVPKNNEKHETKQWIQQWTSKKICSEEMEKCSEKMDESGRTKMSLHALTYSCLTSYKQILKKQAGKRSAFTSTFVCWMYINFCVGGQWNGIPFLVDCPETAFSLRRLDLLQRMIVLGVVWVWNHAAIYGHVSIFDATSLTTPPKECRGQG